MSDKLKEEILKEFKEKFCLIEESKLNQDKWAVDAEVFMAINNFLNRTIDRARREEREEIKEIIENTDFYGWGQPSQRLIKGKILWSLN